MTPLKKIVRQSTLLSLCLLIASLFFLGCKKAEKGPAGAQGPKGDQGPAGTANIKTVRFSNVGTHWVANGSETPSSYAIGYSFVAKLNHGFGAAFDAEVFSYGAVLVYYNDFNSYQWKALPGSVYGNAYEVSFLQSNISSQGIIWLMSSSAASPQVSPGNYIDDVKVIMIGGDSISTGIAGKQKPLSEMPPMERAKRVCPALKDIDLADYNAVKAALKLRD